MDLRLVPIKAQVRRSREGSEEVGTTFVIHSVKKGLKDGNPRGGKPAGRIEADPAWKRRQVAPQGGNGIREEMEPRIAADLADGAQDADGAQLLEDIGVAQDGRFDGAGLVVWLMLANDFQHRRYFALLKARLAQDGRSALTGVRYMIPAAKLLNIGRPMPDEDTEIVKPGSGADHIAVIFQPGSHLLGEAIEARLVAEFVDGKGLFPNEIVKCLKVIHRHENVCSADRLRLENGNRVSEKESLMQVGN